MASPPIVLSTRVLFGALGFGEKLLFGPMKVGRRWLGCSRLPLFGLGALALPFHHLRLLLVGELLLADPVAVGVMGEHHQLGFGE
ncbi:unnamed protein product [Linum trigynum]|uniref:Uncharacterized protein n=1 Tax=Linum trigynum TaxID=586398 RepID=A0AAV2EE17_9ROSI